MSAVSMLVERSLFKDKDGGVDDDDSTSIIKHRFLSFLIWQSIPSTFLFLLTKPPFLFLSFFFSFLSFHFSLILFSSSLFSLSSPQPHPSASISDVLLGSVRFLFVSNSRPLPPDFRRRLRLSLCFVLFVAVSAVSGSLAMLSLCFSFSAHVAFRGFAAGFFYGFYYVYKQRWVLHFPIIQRPPFFSFKMGLPSAIGQALKLSAAGYLFSSILVFLLPSESKSQLTVGKFVAKQFIFYIGNFIVFLCWELSHHLHQVLHTKRFMFAPPKGSAAAETNPSEPLLAALEQSTPKSLLQYLAYLDLCMVCESNVDMWRRAAFFEETGDTYKRVIAICLRPLEQLTLKLGERLESSSVDNPYQLSHQLRSPAGHSDSSVLEAFYDFQLCAWCARIVASLTAHSHKEDRFGVAQLSGSNAAVISTLMSALLAVETLMGKKTHLPSTNHLMGPAGIKWATLSTGSRDSVTSYGVKRRGSPLYAKAYAMADILKISIYSIVSAFHDEMLNSDKARLLEKDWISSSKPPYGTREILLQKLRLFLDFQAS